ncbi:MAG: HAMP domain-containing histidine kinase [Bacteroidales bacterium]|nr:HAMP domain-containing histidine kinase [Bacteroidales bacterium]MCF8387382.1 HAMP domain-containing histidine kinase [Bacteroidales bacterium]MCF8399601.1 HAMP domain-containing histidine kinase [Bacteroidales bacterium]
MKTYFAPAERSSTEEIVAQHENITTNEFLVTISEASNALFMVLNQNRQVVFANKKLLKLLQQEVDAVIGMRPGEMLYCKNARLMKAGCGTHQNCKECGAVNSILQALGGKTDERECRISSMIDNKSVAFDLSIRSQPFSYMQEKYVLFSVIDISDTKRREILERTFLHDVLNTAGGLYGFSEMLKEELREMAQEQYEKAEIIYDLSDRLVQEIKNQQRLRAAENNELIVDVNEVKIPELMNSVINAVKRNTDVAHCSIFLEKCPETIIHTDKVLLQRILINMTKNAAEACKEDQQVTMDVIADEGNVLFSVHNPNFIQENVQKQIFQRSFSTKGSNRGIGTYSMKLFGENYLKGKVWFESTKESGTTFYLLLPDKLS